MTETDVAILEIERRYANAPEDGRKRQAIRAELGITQTGYYQRLNRLIDTREALERDPILVNRLRRLRASRQRTRSVRRGR